MPNRITQSFDQLRRDNRKGLIPFVCAGHPSLDALPDILFALESANATLIEIGIPFSDPIADGPVIAAAMHEALGQGVTPARLFDSVRAARAKGLKAPLAAMVSISIVHRIGPERFMSDAASAGFDGLIIPDLPVEESPDFAALARRANLTMTLLVAPTTPPNRAEQIARASTGFVYLLARVGLTGQSGAALDAAALRPRVDALRRVADLPIACGFGISTASDVKSVVQTGGADAAIVGSALVRAMGDSHQTSNPPAVTATTFMESLRKGLA